MLPRACVSSIYLGDLPRCLYVELPVAIAFVSVMNLPRLLQQMLLMLLPLLPLHVLFFRSQTFKTHLYKMLGVRLCAGS